MTNNLKVDNGALEKNDALNYLISSIGEAQLLLRYAIKKGIDIEDDVIGAIVEARSLFDTTSSESKVAQEIRFWNAFNVLTKHTAPITVTSLKSTKEHCILRPNHSIFRLFGAYKMPSAIKASFIYQTITFFTILFIVVSQIYGTIGTNLVTEIENLAQQIEKLEIEKQKFKIEHLSQQIEGENIKQTNVEEIKNLSEQILRLNDLQMEASKPLEKWQSIGVSFFGFPSQNQIDNCENNQDCDDVMKSILVMSKFILLAIYSYILPILYGFLGASAYILRNLASEIKTLTYTEELNIHYNLRLALGTLSGLAIGWFCKSTPSQAGDLVASLSPLALAFLAGYSVEILFTIMDKMIAVFSVAK